MELADWWWRGWGKQTEENIEKTEPAILAPHRDKWMAAESSPFDSYTMHEHLAYHRSSSPLARGINTVYVYMDGEMALLWAQLSYYLGGGRAAWLRPPLDGAHYVFDFFDRGRKTPSFTEWHKQLHRIKPSTPSIFVAAARRRQTVNSITRYSFPSRLVSKMM